MGLEKATRGWKAVEGCRCVDEKSSRKERITGGPGEGMRMLADEFNMVAVSAVMDPRDTWFTGGR
eukprot:5800533-Lingulodinium_polyedra.AAC.1